MTHRFFIYFSYNGENYCGWQIQPNGITVQEVMEKAMSTILREQISLTAAGRTDAGVHAKQMVAHFDFEDAQPINELFVNKLNSLLPQNISIEKIVEVNGNAHARFDALSRKYEYHISLKKDVFENKYSMRIFNELDFNLMNEAAQTLFDYTDFTSFSKLHTDVKTNNCVIKKAEWTQVNENHWFFTIEADRFLRNMVRAIVGTLIEVGRKNISIEEFRNIIEQKNRNVAGASVPAQGLFLTNIIYPENIFKK